MRLDSMRMFEAAEALGEEVDKLLPRAEALCPRLADHLARSTDSVVLNMAERIGTFQPKVKTAAYAIARNEANEVRAVLRRLVTKRVFQQHETARAYALAGACVGMLTNAIIAVEKRGRHERDPDQRSAR